MARRASWVLVAGASVVLIGQFPAGWAGAQVEDDATSPTLYSAAAQADGMRLEMSLPEGLAVITNEVIDVSGPHAQAVLDSLGMSTSRAAMLYPGDAAIAGSGAAAGAANLPFSPPNYPFYVAATSPAMPESKLKAGAFSLDAAAQPTSANASAHTGNAEPALGHLTAVAHVDLGATGIVAEATSRSEMVSVGEFTIGSVFTRAKVSQAVGAPRVRTTEFRAAGLRVAGLSFDVTSEGLVYPGGKTPLPSEHPVRQVLKQAKTSVTVVAAEETPEGVISAGMSVTSVQPIPGTGRDGTINLSFGRSFAAAGVAGDEADGSVAEFFGSGPAEQHGAGVEAGVSEPTHREPAGPAAANTAAVSAQPSPATSEISTAPEFDVPPPAGSGDRFGRLVEAPSLGPQPPAPSESVAAPPAAVAQSIPLPSGSADYVKVPYAAATLAGLAALAGAMLLRSVGGKA